MSDKHIDDMLRELQDELSAVRPSPEFSAKVRQQVEAQPERRWFGIWQLATAASVVALAALAIVLWSSQATKNDAPAPVVITAQNPPTPLAPVASSTAAAPRRAPVTQPVRVQQVAAREAEVLVPADQRLAVHQLLLSMRTGMLAPPSEKLVDEETGELRVPAAITIRPITVELLPGPADDRGGGRSERR